MRKNHIIVMCISFMMLCGIYLSFQGDMKAESTSINDKGVRINCRDNTCSVDLFLTTSYALSEQISIINQHMNGYNHELSISSENGSITDEQWLEIQALNDFYSIQKLNLKSVKFDSGSMPDNAFQRSLASQSELSLPSNTKITKSSLSGLKGVSIINVNPTNTDIEEGAFDGIYYEPRFNFENYANEVVFLGEFASVHHILKGIKLTEIRFDYSKLGSSNSVHYLENYSGNSLYINNELPISNGIIDFDFLYGDNSGKSKLSMIMMFGEKPKGIRISNASNLRRFPTTNFSVFVVKDCALTKSPTINESYPDFTELDISGNEIDFTDTNNQAFYEKYKTSSFLLGRQKPPLKLVSMADIQLSVGDAIPTITPAYKYADGTTIDFTQSPPAWIDSEYFASYTSKVVVNDSSALTTDNPGTITRSFKSEQGDLLGSVKIVVSANALETPTITLAKTGSTTPTIDDELTLTATMSTTGTENLNSDANVKFMDGQTQLSEVALVNGVAEYKGKLSAGEHSITAIYSGNTKFNSVTSTPAIVVQVTAPSTGLTAQTISFTTPTVNITLGDRVTSNPIVQSDPHGSGSISYESSAPDVATVDASGIVSVLKAGTTTITVNIAADSTYDSASGFYTLTIAPTTSLISQTIDFTNDTVNVSYGEIVSNPIIESDPHGDGVISYASSAPDVATIDASGNVTILKTGTTTITANKAADSAYDSATAQYSLTVEKKEVVVTGLLVEDRAYNGLTNVKFNTENAQVEGILSNDVDQLTFKMGTGTYQDANAGVDKAITLANFVMEGSSAENYELVLPSLTGTITKAELVVNVNNAEKKEGSENPEFTYIITGFVNNETENNLTGYTKPTLQTSADKTSPAGTYAITAKNASSDNYIFTYEDAQLSVKAEVVANDKSYSIEGVLGKNSWYTSKVKIKPSGNFTKVYNGKAWVSELTYEDGIHKDIKLKFKQADNTESNEISIAELKVDTTPPSAQNIKNGDTYFINRAFQAKDDHVVKVRINGLEVSEAELKVIADANKSYSIELEDEAGNVTSLKVDTKSLEETIKPIEDITLENVALKDKTTIEDMLSKVDDLLNDTSNSPTSEQKKQLEETKEKCETLLKQLESNVVDNEDNTTIDTGVNTGDTNNALYYGSICMIALVLITYLKRRTQ